MHQWLIFLVMWGVFGPLSSSGTVEAARVALSQTTTATVEAATTGQQRATFLANMITAPPNIALKVQPARTLRFSKSQLNGLLADLRHEVKSQVRQHAAQHISSACPCILLVNCLIPQGGYSRG